MKLTQPTRAQIDTWIDLLDRSEPSQTGWRSAFDQLKHALLSARGVRDPLRTPGWLAFTALLTVSTYIGWAMPDQLDDRLLVLTVAIAGLLFVWELFVRATFPVLNREGRVSALLRYYGACDVPQQEEVF